MNCDRWERSLPDWELQADDQHVGRGEGLVLVNGKPTEFADVHDGPAVYIGRSNEHYDLSESDLANPFSVDDHGRLEACIEYTDHLIEEVQSNRKFREQVYRLHGRPVACWCYPDLCHGQVLNLFLVYRLHCGWDHERTAAEIKQRLRNHVQHQIEQGNVDPSKYQTA